MGNYKKELSIATYVGVINSAQKNPLQPPQR
jgi:hypothetical protein